MNRSVDGTVDYQARQHEYSFTLTPYNGTASLAYSSAITTLQLNYKSTLLYTERGGVVEEELNGTGDGRWASTAQDRNAENVQQCTAEVTGL